MKFVREYIVKDGKLKLLSLVLATVLWFAISYLGESKMGFSVRVTPVNVGKDLVITRIDAKDVLVTVSGPVSVLKNIKAEEVSLKIDLAGVQDGRHTYNLGKGNVQVPPGVHVESIKPDYLGLDVDKAVEKRLKVVVKMDPRWASAYRVVSAYPTYVTIEGSRESLENRAAIDTLPVDGHFSNDTEEAYVGLNTAGLVTTRVRPEQIRVVLKRQF